MTGTSQRSRNYAQAAAWKPDKTRAEWLATLLFISLAGLTLVSILSLLNLYWLKESSRWTIHTRQVINKIDVVEKALTSAEIWYQMYQLTGDAGGLWRSEKEFARGEQAMPAAIELTSDNPVQTEALQELAKKMDRWKLENYPHPDRSAPFLKAVKELQALRSREEGLLAVRSRRAKSVRDSTFITNCVLVGFSFISLLFLWRRWNQENRWTAEILNRLSAAEARFQSFMDHSPLLAFIKGQRATTVYCNEPWKNFTGVEFDDATQSYRANDTANQFQKHEADVFASNSAKEYLETITDREGMVHQFMLVLFPFTAGNDEQLLGGLALDVTEAKQTQQALEKSEERLQLALQAGAMNVWEIDLDTEEVYAKAKVFQIDADESFRKTPYRETLKLIHPEDRETVHAKIQRAKETGETYHAVYRTVFGQWMSSYGAVQYDEDQKPVRMIGVLQDQTDKVEAELKLAGLRKLHQSILKCAHVALISIDKSKKVTSWNPAAARMLGYTAEEVVGKATPDLWHSPADVRARAEELGLKGHLHVDPFLSEALLRGEDTQECIFTRKDGTRLPVRLTITPIFDEEGGLIGFLKQAIDISELRQANHQVHELSAALQYTVSGWAKLDQDGRYTAMNHAYAESAGYNARELLGLQWHATVHQDDVPAVMEAYQEMLATGHAETRARGMRKDGSFFHQEIFLSQACDYLGSRTGSYCFMRDITRRVNAEQNLAASERRYRELFELNPIPCWIYNPQTLRFVDVNEAAIQHYGYSQEEFMAMEITALRVPEEAALIESELTRFTKTGSWTSGPWHHRLRDGRLIDVEVAARRLSDTARLVVIRDITEQRQAELVRKSEAQLQEAQRIARLGSWELDSKSGAVSWSPETFRIFGLDGFKGKLQFEDFLQMVHPDDREQVSTAVANSLQRAQVYDLQFRILRQNGDLRHIHGRGEFSNGSRQCLAGTMLDITEERQSHEALQQSLEEKEVLIKEIHHRVKNNLQVISCLLNMQAGVVNEDGAVAALQDSERRVMAMAGIHERLYGHKRLDRINFKDYAESLVQDLIGSYATKSGPIDSTVSVAPIDLHIEQAIPCGLILNELITNALKYAYDDGQGGKIFVTLEQLPDEKLSLSVADQGRGLPENFDWRKSKSLGVSIVNLLTRQLGGSMKIETSAAGVTFTVTFKKVK